MQATVDSEHASEAKDKGAASSPVRILVQTQTHLVPGDGWWGKMAVMKSTIAESVLKREFDSGKDRIEVYNDIFAVPGYHCFFLYDHASSPIGDEVADHDIPLLWYRWTGDKLIALNQAPPQNIQQTIKTDYPFKNRVHPPKSPRDEKLTKEEIEKQRSEETPEARIKRRRDIVRVKVRRLLFLTFQEQDWLTENPQQEDWLKDNVEPGAWLWYERIKDEYDNGPPWADD